MKKTCVYFVLDCKFEHFMIYEICRHFIFDLFKSLDASDSFGLLCLDQSELH